LRFSGSAYWYIGISYDGQVKEPFPKQKGTHMATYTVNWRDLIKAWGVSGSYMDNWRLLEGADIFHNNYSRGRVQSVVFIRDEIHLSIQFGGDQKRFLVGDYCCRSILFVRSDSPDIKQAVARTVTEKKRDAEFLVTEKVRRKAEALSALKALQCKAKDSVQWSNEYPERFWACVFPDGGTYIGDERHWSRALLNETPRINLYSLRTGKFEQFNKIDLLKQLIAVVGTMPRSDWEQVALRFMPTWDGEAELLRKKKAEHHEGARWQGLMSRNPYSKDDWPGSDGTPWY